MKLRHILNTAFSLITVAACATIAFGGSSEEYRQAMPVRVIADPAAAAGYNEGINLSFTNSGTWRKRAGFTSVIVSTNIAPAEGGTVLVEGINVVDKESTPANTTEGTTLATICGTGNLAVSVTPWDFVKIRLSQNISSTCGSSTIYGCSSSTVNIGSMWIPGFEVSPAPGSVWNISGSTVVATCSGTVATSNTYYNVRDSLRGATEGGTVLTVAITNGATLTIPAGITSYEIRVDAACTPTEFVYSSVYSMADAANLSGFPIDKAGKYVDGVLMAAKTHYFALSGAYAVRVYARWVLAP